MGYEPIAIIGYGVMYPPDSFSNESFWENIINGTSGIREVTDDVWSKDNYYSIDRKKEDKTYCKKSGFLDTIPKLDEFFERYGIEKNELNHLNRNQQLVLNTIFQALDNGSLSLQDIRKGGIVIGNMLGDIDICDVTLASYAEEFLEDLEKVSLIKDQAILAEVKNRLEEEINQKFLQNNKAKEELVANNLSEKIVNLLHLEKESMVIDGACSGSIVAIDEAIKLVHDGKMSTCIVSGVLGNMGVTGNVAFSKIGGLSSTFAKPLDKNNDGLTPGEGAGTIIIKKLKDAIADGNLIYGVIRGSGVASDGGGQSIYAPSTSGQYLSMKKSLVRANMTMKNVDYIEMHATGTPVGDKVELKSIMKLCEEDLEFKAPLSIGSIKSQIGHSFSGAGIANLVKVLLGMKHKQLPPTYHFSDFSDDMVAAKEYLSVNTKLRDWVKVGNEPRRAMVNAFGFGGINGNLLIEEFDSVYHGNLLDEQTQIEKFTGGYAIVGIGLHSEEYASAKDWQNNHTLKKEPLFPFVKYKIPPKILNKIDKAQQISLIAASEAFEEVVEPIDRERVGVYAGLMMGLKNSFFSDIRVRSVEYTSILKNIVGNMLTSEEYEMLEEQFKSRFETIEEDSLPGFMDNIVASRISNYFNLQGCNVVFDSGCSSFSTALSQGLLSLKNYENSLILVGGVHANDIKAYKDIFMNAYQMPSKDFEKLKNGACFFAIKRLEDVEASEKIYGKLKEPNFKRQKLFYEEFDQHYFGADDAFQMLELLKELESSETENVTMQASSFAANGYDIELYKHTAELSENEMYKIFFISEKDLSDENINKLVSDSVFFNEYLRSQEQIKNGKAVLAIVYQSKQELEQKLTLLQKVVYP